MKFLRTVRIAAAGVLACLFSLPALATWDGEVVVTGTSLNDVNSSTLSFSSGGTEVPVTVKGEDDDGNVILGLGFAGNSASAGTLTIGGAGGTPKSIALPAAGQGQRIYVDTDGPGSASLTRPTPVASGPRSVSSYYFPSNRIGLNFGALNLSGGDIATSGTILPSGPGSEFPSLRADYDVDATGGGLTYAHNFGRGLPSFIDPGGLSSNLTLSLGYSNYSDDNSSRFEEPSGGASTGFLLTVLDPAPNDQTGANLGAFGIQSVADIDIDFQRFDAGVSWLCDRELPYGAFMVPKFTFAYTQWDVDLSTRDTFEPTFPSADFFNTRTQSLEQTIYDFGIGATFVNPLGHSGRFDVFLDAVGRLYYNDADLTSNEQFGIGMGPQDRQFSRSDNDTSFGLDLGVGFGWNISGNLRATATLTTYLNAASATIDNPVRGDGSNPGSDPLTLTQIDFDNQNLWGANLSVTYNFGG